MLLHRVLRIRQSKRRTIDPHFRDTENILGGVLPWEAYCFDALIRGNFIMTDERLKAAAALVNDAMVRYYDQYFDPDQQPEFSRHFEKKMKQLFWRISHPRLYQLMCCTASTLPLIIIGAGIAWIVGISAKHRDKGA